MSKVMQDGTGAIKFRINEPAEGRTKSQTEPRQQAFVAAEPPCEQRHHRGAALHSAIGE